MNLRLLEVEKKEFELFIASGDFRARDNWSSLCDMLLEVGRGSKEIVVNGRRVPPVLISRMKDMLGMPNLRTKFGNLQFRHQDYRRMSTLPPSDRRERNKLQWSLVSAIAEVTEEFFHQLDKLLET